jgi:hypothetical protein
MAASPPEDAEWYYNTVNEGDPVIVQEVAGMMTVCPPPSAWTSL